MVVYGTRSLERKEQAYELLRLGAAEFWGMEELPPLERGERGKPWMPQLPNRHFNLSHSGTLALCALSAQPVGVDIQVVRVWRDSLLERSCTPRERAWLRERTRWAAPGAFAGGKSWRRFIRPILWITPPR